MALMDAGILVREHVAGVSVGLVSEIDSTTGEIKDYRILTDILVRYSIIYLLVSFVLECLVHACDGNLSYLSQVCIFVGLTGFACIICQV